MSYGKGICGAYKAHRTTIQNSVSINAWSDCDNFTEISDETQGEVAELNIDNKTIDIKQDGFYMFGGCLHVQNNTGGLFSSVKVLSRILFNAGEASEAELRCSQRGFVKNIAASGEDIISYNGTAKLAAGDTLRLQYYTDETDIDFFSNSDFANQVAYTIWLIRCGD